MDEEDKDVPVLRDAPGDAVSELKAPEQPKVLIDGGTVVMMMAVEGQGIIPIPIPAVFQQLFSIFNHIDQRLLKVEERLQVNPDGDSRIITLN